jgi:hypothetical protein
MLAGVRDNFVQSNRSRGQYWAAALFFVAGAIELARVATGGGRLILLSGVLFLVAGALLYINARRSAA